MVAWMTANSGDIIVLSGLALVVVAVIVGMLRDKKKGKGCCGGCSGCSAAGGCSGCTACNSYTKK